MGETEYTERPGGIFVCGDCGEEIAADATVYETMECGWVCKDCIEQIISDNYTLKEIAAALGYRYGEAGTVIPNGC